jgi:hypothetical protein
MRKTLINHLLRTASNLLLYTLAEPPFYPICYWNWSLAKNEKTAQKNEYYNEINPAKEAIEDWLEKRPIIFNQNKKTEKEKNLLKLINERVKDFYF